MKYIFAALIPLTPLHHLSDEYDVSCMILYENVS